MQSLRVQVHLMLAWEATYIHILEITAHFYTCKHMCLLHIPVPCVYLTNKFCQNLNIITSTTTEDYSIMINCISFLLLLFQLLLIQTY